MEGQILGRLESRDLVAALNRAAANVALQRAEIVEAEVAETEARLSLSAKRSTDL